jgi:ribosomal protein S27AE
MPLNTPNPTFTQTEIDPYAQKKSKRSARSRHKKSRIPPWIRDYRVELGLALTFLFAIFLLIEQWEIRKTLYIVAFRLINSIEKSTSTIWNTFFQWFKGLTLSDATAIILLAGVIIIAGLRLRWRINRSPRLQSTHCPQCNAGGLKRIHRRLLERLPTLVGIPARRYLCGQCGWRGMRIHSMTKPKRSKSPSNNADRTAHF